MTTAFGEETPLLPFTRPADWGLPSLEDQVYAEDSPSGSTATYWDPGRWRVQIEYDTSRTPFWPQTLYSGQPAFFQSREDMLTYENGKRLEARTDLPDKEKYHGFVRHPMDTTTMSKVMIFITKPLIWIAGFFIRLIKGQEYYDQWIMQKDENLRRPNYSAKNVSNFNIYATPVEAILRELGLDPSEAQKLYTRSVWHKNSPLNGYAFVNEKGEMERISDAVSASNDRSAPTLIMAREVQDQDFSRASIAYTGRPDTERRAEEQVAMIFSREMEKSEAHRKGITYNAEEGVYELTYLVTNLMTPIKEIGYFTFDEKKSIEKEGAILEALSHKTLIIGGKKVRVKPLYFSQPFNWQNHVEHLVSDETSGRQFRIETNRKGYASLNRAAQEWLAKNPEHIDNALLKKALDMLNNHLEELAPQEELFYRDLIAKILKLPLVYHCKSSTDRTIIALAISVALYLWRKCGKDLSANPHDILKTPLFKELFVMHVMSGHQVTRVSRSYEGTVNGNPGNERAIGFDWGKGFFTNSVAIELLPDRYKTPAKRPKAISAMSNTKKLMRKVSSPCLPRSEGAFEASYEPPYSKAYPKEHFDRSYPGIVRRSLFKREGMIV